MTSTDDGTEGRWLTYDELAQVRGIKRIGAVRLAQRQRWRRQPGNDGKVRVMVPTEALALVRGTREPQPDKDHAHDGARDGAVTMAAAFEHALAAIREAHAGEVTALRQQLDRARAEAQEAQQAAEALRERVEALEAERMTAVAQAEAARGRAEAAGRLAEAAQEKVAQAEAAFTGERDARVAAEARATADHDRAEAARQRADEAEEYSTRLVAELDDFRAKAEDAQTAAEALQQAETDRRARGRLRRVLAAWRGE